MNIQQVIETYGSKDSSNRVYLSASSIIAQCAKTDIAIDEEALNTLNEFMSGLRNRPYETRQLPSGKGHEHIYEALPDEDDVIRLRIEPKISQSGKEYTGKKLIICPKPTAFTPFNRLNIPSVRSASADPVYAGSPDEEVNRPSDVVEEVQF